MKSYKAAEIAGNELLFAAGYWKLMVVRIINNPRRLEVLGLIFANPGSDDDKIGLLYRNKYGRDIARSTLNSDLRSLAKYGLCETERSGRKKLYRLSGFFQEYLETIKKLGRGQRLDLSKKIACVLKG
ncbi:MAG TPA: hypothetical protein P5080_06180 [Candidatus Paceibacterota bacterium]|nr:hypothetical protein [Candidatus Pacearchaeota archaeon]HRZ51532.1 hypothetical protein [Candidatus Paceibacterota bacterium]HSA37254.1 hypothetical protein [Candidatus Paceibacterota bacterium]